MTSEWSSCGLCAVRKVRVALATGTDSTPRRVARPCNAVDRIDAPELEPAVAAVVGRQLEARGEIEPPARGRDGLVEVGEEEDLAVIVACGARSGINLQRVQRRAVRARPRWRWRPPRASPYSRSPPPNPNPKPPPSPKLRARCSSVPDLRSGCRARWRWRLRGWRGGRGGR